MPDQSIFGKENNQEEATPQNQPPSGGGGVPNNDPFADLLGSIVNERGERKYNSVEEALKGATHAQDFIKQLKEENERMRNELSMKNDLEERYRNIEESVKKLTSREAPNEPTPQNGVSQEELSAIVNNILHTRDVETSSKKNLDTVVSAMLTKFGDQAEKEFYGKAQEFGMTKEGIESLARTSPQAIFRLFGIDGVQNKPASPNPTVGSVNTSGISPREESSIKPSTRRILNGGTTHDLLAEVEDAKKMVEELEKMGMSSHDLSNPKNYRKFMQRNK